jgi:hypothetical protein
MKIKWLDRRIAGAGPYLCLCLSQEEFRKVTRHLNAPVIDWLNKGADATTHFFANDGHLTAVVCLGSVAGKDSTQIVSLLVHEAVHVWQEYARSIGERTPGDEQEAYAVQAVSQELMTEYARRIFNN